MTNAQSKIALCRANYPYPNLSMKKFASLCTKHFKKEQAKGVKKSVRTSAVARWDWERMDWVIEEDNSAKLSYQHHTHLQRALHSQPAWATLNDRIKMMDL